MRRMRQTKRSLIAILCMGLVVPCHASVAEEVNRDLARPSPSLRLPVADVALQPDGFLRGQVVDAQGSPSADLDLRVWRGINSIAESRTDAKGQFEIALKQGGVYRVSTNKNAVTFRVWQFGTEPPKTPTQALIVNDENVLRAQWSPTQALFAHPGIAAGLGALLIAIPIILHNNRDDRTPPAS